MLKYFNITYILFMFAILISNCSEMCNRSYYFAFELEIIPGPNEVLLDTDVITRLISLILLSLSLIVTNSFHRLVHTSDACVRIWVAPIFLHLLSGSFISLLQEVGRDNYLLSPMGALVTPQKFWSW